MKKIEEGKKRVAIIRVYGAIGYDSYGDYASTSNIVQHVTDWEEVTDSELYELKNALNYYSTGDYRFVLIEQMDSVFMNKTVNDYRKFLKSEEDKRKKEQEEYARKQAEAKAKREQKKLEKIAKDKEKFKKMAAEMGLTVVEND